MSSWPATLPQTALLGATIGDDESRLISSMDAGPALVRKRFTSFTQSIAAPIILTGAQLATFNTFYRTTLNQGTNSFTWKNPADDSTVSMRFKKPPVWQSIRSGSPDERLWRSTLELEVLP